MTDDPNRPAVLTSVPNEAQAHLIAAALQRHGVQAQIEGALTSGFRAEVPGQVQVVVRQADVERARDILEDLKSDTGERGGRKSKDP